MISRSKHLIVEVNSLLSPFLPGEVGFLPSAALSIDNSSTYLREGLEHRTYSERSWRGREARDFVEPALEETLYFSDYITSATPPFVRELTQVLSPRRGFCFSVGRAAILTS